MTETVAITGVTGFIGKHIADNLLARGFRVRALTRTLRQHSPENLTWVRGALEDKASLAELVSTADYVVHCAGQVRGHSEEIFVDSNVTGSLNLMQAALENKRCRRFLFMSSLAARHPDLSWYAKSKRTAEQELDALAASSPVTLGIFRPTAVYGPGDKEMKPLFDWMLRGILPRLGDSDAKLSFLHVSDLAEAVGQWLVSEQPPARPCELCDGDAAGYNWQRVRDIGEKVRNGRVRLVGVPLPVLKLLADISVLSCRLAGKEPMLTRSKIHELTHQNWSASNNGLCEEINWFPRISLEHALRERLF